MKRLFIFLIVPLAFIAGGLTYSYVHKLGLPTFNQERYFIEKTDKYNIGDILGGHMLIVGKDRALDYSDWQYEYILINTENSDSSTNKAKIKKNKKINSNK